mmetsp:Transcript_60631/g.172314  ORF Transcript_60631/g.172314 Transcript_60631/m.172314 type:complete len:501 (+) Transcript_60631:100-1602(+)
MPLPPVRLLGSPVPAACVWLVCNTAAAISARRQIPHAGQPRWFGYTFDDSPAAGNVWMAPAAVPDAVIGDMEPVAPHDRLDKVWIDSLTGAAPLEPGEQSSTAKNHQPPMRPDWVPQYAESRTFPADEGPSESREPTSPIVPLGKKHVVSKMDRLRPPYGTWELVRSRLLGAGDNYPNVAPADRIRGEPVAIGDVVPRSFSRYFDQVHDRNVQLKHFQREGSKFNQTDLDQDSAISHEEFKDLLRSKQNKSAEEADRLWGKFHTSRGTEMTKDEFRRLVRTGFDLGSINRSDVSSVLAPPRAAAKGFWGSGAACPSGAHAVGAKLKVMPQTAGIDNTGLNSVGLRCSDGTEVTSIEGPHGEWTSWADCPQGQQIYGFRMQRQASVLGKDDAGIAALEFICRAPDLSAFDKLQFHTAVQATAAASMVSAGWGSELVCPPKEAVCGAQANVLRDQGAGDDMGITDIRVYCCNMKVDCSSVCGGAKAHSVRCAVCRQVMDVLL